MRARNASSPGEIASSPGGDASPRRHLLVKARCLDKQIQYIFLLPSWGIEPQLGNADAGTRRPQVRTRCPQVRTHHLQVRTRPQKLTHKKKPLSTNLLKEACKKVGGDLLSRGCAVPSARLGLTSLFGMGRGDPQRYNHQNIGWTTLFT